MTESINQVKSELMEAVMALYVVQARAEKFKKDAELKFQPLANELTSAAKRVEALQDKLNKKVKKHVSPDLLVEQVEVAQNPSIDGEQS